jgi:protein disulfide isomerase family A protein 3
MKSLAILFMFVGATLCSDVLELTDSNFNNQVKDKEILLVEFFAPWCGHCKRLAPEYETAATALLKNDPPIPIAKADCVGEAKDSCTKYGVSGYPTLKIFRNGAFSQEYDGPRDSAGIISYMKKNSGPSSVELRDIKHLDDKLAKAEEIVVVGFFSEGSDLKEKFLAAADEKRNNYGFSHTSDDAIMDHAGHKDAIVLFRPKHMHAKFEDSKVVLDSASSKGDIVDFIANNHIGLVGQMVPDIEDLFTKPLVVVYYKVDWKRNAKGSKYWRNRVARVAKKFPGELTFAIAAKKDYGSKMSDWGFDADSESVHAVAFNAKKQPFKMEDEFSVANLEKFANAFKNDELKPYIKSAPLPDNNDGPVKVVVGQNFDEIVNDNTKDVLIEFYAPWCGHCKSLEPTFNELGEALAGVKDITIAKMDATANDVPPPFEVSGFPTLYWAPMGKKDRPKKYQGGRSKDDFINFIKSEATNPFELSDKKKKKKAKKEDL